MPASSPYLSVVVPVFNEQEVIPLMQERLGPALGEITEDFEVIFVDDGSSDKTLALLRAWHQQDARFKVLKLSRNFGHQKAIWAGLNYAKGEFVGIMDGDLQDPPEFFATMHAKLEEGYDLAYAVRKKRKENIFKRFAYWLYYRILQMTSNIVIPLDSGDFSLMRRRFVDALLTMQEEMEFIRGLRAWVGFRQVGMEYDRSERAAGNAKYTFRKLLELAYGGLFSFSEFPIRFLGKVGLVMITGFFAYFVYIIYKYFWGTGAPEGFTTLISVIMLFAGIQLISFRIIGEYIHRSYAETRRRPNYLVEEELL